MWSFSGTQKRITVISCLGMASPLSCREMRVFSPLIFEATSFAVSRSLISSSFGGIALS
jgi:hypothetical protein